MSNATTQDVLDGKARWSCVQSDAVAFLKGLPDDSVDLLFTSPPYLEARTYGTEGVSRAIDAWVPWMMELFRAAAPKVKGLIAVNCEGQTRKYAYQPAPFLLVADLFREGFSLRKPVVFHRVGIPGSGGPDWLRNDWEPIICVTRPGRLPWSEPTACGHPPKFGPGGEMSHRNGDGVRVNQWGKRTSKTSGANKKADGEQDTRARPSHVFVTAEEVAAGAYVPPVKANPGNVVADDSEDGRLAQAVGVLERVATGDLHPSSLDARAAKERLAYAYIAGLAGAGNVNWSRVGGHQMGHDLAHENEAPFPLKLAAFFVKSFCPPGGVTCDVFSGSGTTCHAAVENGRRFVGCDLRESQVLLCERRLATVTPDLFAEVA